MAFEVKDYATAREHDNRLKRCKAWEKENGYERYDWALCLHCSFFTINNDLPIVGECSLRDKEGVYESVSTDSVCDRYISRRGTDINGKKINQSLLSVMFNIEKLKDGSVYIPRSSVA